MKIAPPEAPLQQDVVALDEAARLLGVAASDVRFLVACAVLAAAGEGVRRESLARFLAEVRASLAPGETVEAGVRRAIAELRHAWDRALVERGPSPVPETRVSELLPGVVELGRHPDGTLVLAAPDEGASHAPHEVSAVAERVASSNVRVLAVERELLERWGLPRETGKVVAAKPYVEERPEPETKKKRGRRREAEREAKAELARAPELGPIGGDPLADLVELDRAVRESGEWPRFAVAAQNRAGSDPFADSEEPPAKTPEGRAAPDAFGAPVELAAAVASGASMRDGLAAPIDRAASASDDVLRLALDKSESEPAPELCVEESAPPEPAKDVASDEPVSFRRPPAAAARPPIAFAPPPPPPPIPLAFAPAGAAAASPMDSGLALGAPPVGTKGGRARNEMAPATVSAPPSGGFFQRSRRASGATLAGALRAPGALMAPPPVAAPLAKPANTTPAEDEAETFERKATVRYYSQMYARRNYPLLVVVSKRSIQKIVQEHVAQVESKKSFKIRRGNPFVTVRPIIPGCLCVPAEITLDVKPKVAEAKFWVTPQAEGELEEARVEVLYEGKVVSTIATPTRVTTQALAKASGALAFFSTSAGPVFDAFGGSAKHVGASFVADLLAKFAASGWAGNALAATFAFVALAFYLRKRPRAGPEIDGFFDWGVEEELEGDPLVRALKAKLAIVGPEGRHVVDLVHGTTLVGSGETAHVRIRGSRTLPAVACELRYEDERGFVLRAKAAGVSVDGEPVALEGERRIGRDATVELEGGKVSLWVLDVRQDAALDARREAVLEALVAARPMFETELRALFRRTAAEPVRAAVLEAVRASWTDPLGWARVRRAWRNG